MKSSCMLALATAAALLVLPSCVTAKIEGHGSKPLALNQISDGASFRSFEISEFSAFDWTNTLNVDDLLRESDEVKLGDPSVSHVQNLRIEVRSDFGTFFANLFTLGLANAKRYSIKGDVVPN